LFTDPFWLQKLNTDTHILTHVSIVNSDDKYQKLKMYISELILDRYAGAQQYA